jgi:signal transduction histidine kinase
VQEALTNAHKYGDGPVRLRISHAADGVALELINPVAVPPVGDAPLRRDAASDAGGFGLMGMRERVLAAGGSLHVGPEGETRFAVRAHFPSAEEQR